MNALATTKFAQNCAKQILYFDTGTSTRSYLCQSISEVFRWYGAYCTRGRDERKTSFSFSCFAAAWQSNLGYGGWGAETMMKKWDRFFSHAIKDRKNPYTCLLLVHLLLLAQRSRTTIIISMIVFFLLLVLLVLSRLPRAAKMHYELMIVLLWVHYIAAPHIICQFSSPECLL